MSRYRRNNKWRRRGTAAIITAAVIVLYPLLTNFYAWYEQSVLKQQSEQVGTYAVNDAAIEANESTPLIAWGRLDIPKLGLSTVVVEGTTKEMLAKAPGWYTDSALPGMGNTAIAGHLNVYGSYFRLLHKLQPGDEIVLTYKGETFRYKVEKVTTIDSNNWSLIEPCGYTALTLTTCTKEGKDMRTAVRARLAADRTEEKEK